MSEIHKFYMIEDMLVIQNV